jgi:hypothetical protein
LLSSSVMETSRVGLTFTSHRSRYEPQAALSTLTIFFCEGILEIVMAAIRKMN